VAMSLILASGMAKSQGGLDVDAKIAQRKSKMEERKRELLLEARTARMNWIHSGDVVDSGKNIHARNVPIFDDGDVSNSNRTNLLNELQACSSGILPCAPQIIESMLYSSRKQHHGKMKGGASKNRNETLKQVLEKQSLPWGSVSKLSPIKGHEEVSPTSTKGESDVADAAVKNSMLDLPPIPHPQYYSCFLNTLCEPPAADLVISIQNFCKTIQEAANVMVSSMKDDANDNGGGSGKDAPEITRSPSNLTMTLTSSQQTQALNHGASLAKALRGFINKTMREMEAHESFQNHLYPKKTTEENNPPNDTSAANINTVERKSMIDVDVAARDQLLASLEKFVYSKCRGDIDIVLLAALEGGIGQDSTKTLNDSEVELHDKMQSLQFVTPAHLEIQSLKSPGRGNQSVDDTPGDIDLSFTIQKLQSVHDQASPRQMLQTILLAHRGVTVALNEACGNSDPPGADDILPTLILATLRSQTPHLPSALRFIESFAQLPLLRGEAGYAYTNLCGAVQFINEFDMDGHLSEVTLLDGAAGGRSSVLSIGPEEFRIGLEGCRKKMRLKVEEEQLSRNQPANSVGVSDEVTAVQYDTNKEDCINVKNTSQPKITAQDVREARSQGEIVNLDWAIKNQTESMWQQGKVADMSIPAENQAMDEDFGRDRHHLIPPENPPLPAQFTRSYSFLTAHPDNIGLRDLPQLLKEYKLLVHATEKLLNERFVWKESERKRQLKLEREHLERDFGDVIGVDDDENGMELANGY